MSEAKAGSEVENEFLESPFNLSQSMRRRVIFSTVLGNSFEWFDFVVYTLFATTIARVIFPVASDSSAILLSLATYGVAFCFRPLGGFVFGFYADRFGRTRALSFMILMMAAGSFLVGIAPTFSAAGFFAPLVVVLARMLQGFSVGAEFANGTAMLVEFAPKNRRGFYGSMQICSQGFAFLISAVMALALTKSLSAEAFESWGWRVPFLLGTLIGPLGFYLRRRVGESPEFQEFKNSRLKVDKVSVSLRELFVDYKKELLVSFSITSGLTSMIYFLIGFLPVFATQQLKLESADVQKGLIITALSLTFIAPIAGRFSDYVNKRKMIIFAVGLLGLGFLVSTHFLLKEPSFRHLICVQLLAVIATFAFAPGPTLLAELFPVKIRSSGMSISYNLSVLIFGGLSPFFCASLVSMTGSNFAPVYYVLSTLVATFVALLCARSPAEMKATV